MKRFCAILLYHCFINNEKTSDIDIKVYFFEDISKEKVYDRLRNMPEQEYNNINDEKVVWKLKEVAQVEEVEKFEDGQEIIGCIRNYKEMAF